MKFTCTDLIDTKVFDVDNFRQAADAWQEWWNDNAIPPAAVVRITSETGVNVYFYFDKDDILWLQDTFKTTSDDTIILLQYEESE